jgi:hypothetical protein
MISGSFLILKLSYVASYSVSPLFRRNVGESVHKFFVVLKGCCEFIWKPFQQFSSHSLLQFFCTYPKLSLVLHDQEVLFLPKHQHRLLVVYQVAFLEFFMKLVNRFIDVFFLSSSCTNQFPAGEEKKYNFRFIHSID